MMEPDLIFAEIKAERERQIAKFGVQRWEPIEWVAILTEEVGEVSREALEMHFTQFHKDTGQKERYKKELIQSAAVIFAMLESY